MGRPSIWDYTDEQLAAMPEQEFMALDRTPLPTEDTKLDMDNLLEY
jgi:hypothetical protein